MQSPEPSPLALLGFPLSNSALYSPASQFPGVRSDFCFYSLVPSIEVEGVAPMFDLIVPWRPPRRISLHLLSITDLSVAAKVHGKQPIPVEIINNNYWSPSWQCGGVVGPFKGGVCWEASRMVSSALWLLSCYVNFSSQCALPL